MFWGITLILLSIIAVPSLILAKKPEAKELLKKIEPYQGWLGLAFCVWGVWGVITAFLNISLLSTSAIWWTTLLAGNLIEAILGFMLSIGLINKWILSKNETAKEKASKLREKLAPNLGKLGLLGIAVGAWMIIASFIFDTL